MRTASGVAVLLLFRAGHGVIEEQIAAFGDIKAVFFQIAVCRCLRANGFQFTLHAANNDQRQKDAYHDRNGDLDHGQRLTGQISLVKGRPVPRLSDKLVTQACIGIEGSGVVAA